MGGRCDVSGVVTEPEPSCVIRDRRGTIFLVGSPPRSALVSALRPSQDTSIISAVEHGEWIAKIVPTWARSRILVYELPSTHGASHQAPRRDRRRRVPRPALPYEGPRRRAPRRPLLGRHSRGRHGGRSPGVVARRAESGSFMPGRSRSNGGTCPSTRCPIIGSAGKPRPARHSSFDACRRRENVWCGSRTRKIRPRGASPRS